MAVGARPKAFVLYGDTKVLLHELLSRHSARVAQQRDVLRVEAVACALTVRVHAKRKEIAECVTAPTNRSQVS